jgi:hypothetical protein
MSEENQQEEGENELSNTPELPEEKEASELFPDSTKIIYE